MGQLLVSLKLKLCDSLLVCCSLKVIEAEAVDKTNCDFVCEPVNDFF